MKRSAWNRWALPGLLGLILVLGACHREDIPPLDLDRMEAVLSDIQEAEVYSSMIPDTLHKWTNKNKDSLYRFYMEIFAHHNLDPLEFEKALAWYAARPR